MVAFLFKISPSHLAEIQASHRLTSYFLAAATIARSISL